MVMKIGEDAGRVYEFLRGKGQVGFKEIVKGTKLKQQETDRAIGWLGREGKIAINRQTKEEFIALTE